MRLEATTGEALTVQNITGDLLAGFGIASTGNAFSGYEDAEASGSVDLASLSRIIDLAGSQAGASFTVQVGDGTATEISVDNATTPQDLLDQLNAVQGLTASFNPDGTLALTAADAQAITLQNVSGSLLEDFGFSTTSLGGSNAVALGNDTLSLNTRFDAISRKKGDNQSLSLTKNGTTYNFNTGTDRTVGDLLAEIDAVEGITAELTEDGKVRIEATDGQSFQLNGNAWDLLGTRKGTYASEATTGLIANPTALYEGPAYAQIQAATHNETIRVASANAHPQNSYDTLVHRAEFGPVSETTYVHQANGGSTDELVYVHRAEEQSETVDVVTENDVVSAGAETQEITEDFVGLDEAEFISEASTGENSETNTNAAAASVHAADVARDGKVAAKRILDELTDKFAELSRNGIDLVRGRSRTASLDERGTSATVYGKDLTLDGLGLGDDFKLGSLDDIDALLDTVNSAIDDAATLKGEIDRKNGQITAHQGFAEMLSDSLESGEVAADATGSATDDDPLAKAKETGQMFLKLSQSLAGQLTDQLRVSGF